MPPRGVVTGRDLLPTPTPQRTPRLDGDGDLALIERDVEDPDPVEVEDVVKWMVNAHGNPAFYLRCLDNNENRQDPCAFPIAAPNTTGNSKRRVPNQRLRGHPHEPERARGVHIVGSGPRFRGLNVGGHRLTCPMIEPAAEPDTAAAVLAAARAHRECGGRCRGGAVGARGELGGDALGGLDRGRRQRAPRWPRRSGRGVRGADRGCGGAAGGGVLRRRLRRHPESVHRRRPQLPG